MATSTAGSTLIRRRLGLRLRRLREQAGKRREDVAETDLVGSVQKLWRIETGRTSIRPADVIALCQLYGVPADEAADMAQMARATAGRTSADVPDWFELYVELEAGADRIRAWSSGLVHGLLQTTDYAHALLTAGARDVDEAEIDRRLTVRQQRQEAVIGRTDLRIILWEAALTMEVGTPKIMRAQVAHLNEMADHPRIDLRFLPWDAHVCSGALGPFSLLEFDGEEDPDVVYVEGLASASYRDEPAVLASHSVVWRAL